MARSPLGRRGLSLLAQPQPGALDPLVEETREPPRASATRLRADRVQESPGGTTRTTPNGIGPKRSNRNERLCRANALCGRIAASSVAPIVGLSALPVSLRCARLSRPLDERHYGSTSKSLGSLREVVTLP